MKMKTSIISTVLLLNLVNYINLLFKEAFTRMGLFKRQEDTEEDFYSADSFNGYVLLTDSRTSSMVPVPVQVLTAMIKKNLPVVEYGNFKERVSVSVSASASDEQHADQNINKTTICTVCLDSMAESDEMRELCKCRHVFHKDCLDTWVNEGQVTCPLCRSTLYPEQIDWTGRSGS